MTFAAQRRWTNPFLYEAVHRDTDSTSGQTDDRAYRIDGQWAFMEQRLQHVEIRVAEIDMFNSAPLDDSGRGHSL